MSAIKRFEALERRCTALEEQIDDAYLHHASDEELKRLKLIRLKLQEQLNSLEV